MIQYLNTDLDLISPDDLTALAAELARRGVRPLHVTRCEDGLWRACFETDEQHTEPGPNIDAMLVVLVALATPLRGVWTGCTLREFNIGYDCGSEPWAFNQGLSAELLGRIAAAGASLRVTLYPDREPGTPNQRLGIRQQLIAALSHLIGLPLTAARRAADMRTFQFGELVPVRRGSVGDFALHVQCPWRIEGPDGMVTGRYDLYKPVDEHAPFDEDWDYERSPNLQDARVEAWLASHGRCLVVQRVEADEFGGAAISFDRGFVLRWFPHGTRSENWRLFRPRTDAAHLVVSGGAIEEAGDLGA